MGLTLRQPQAAARKLLWHQALRLSSGLRKDSNSGKTVAGARGSFFIFFRPSAVCFRLRSSPTQRRFAYDFLRCEGAMTTYLSISQFSAETTLSLATVRRRLKDGSIPSIQPGGSRTKILIPVSALTEPPLLQSTRSTGLNSSPLPDASSSNPQSQPQARRGPRPHWKRLP